MFREKCSFQVELPVTGKETILDAINFAGGMSAQADHKGVVLYRQPSKGGPLEALPIDIDQITMGDDLSTNYQLLPGDRLVVPRNANSKPDATKPRPSLRSKFASSNVALLSTSIVDGQRDTPAEQARHGASEVARQRLVPAASGGQAERRRAEARPDPRSAQADESPDMASTGLPGIARPALSPSPRRSLH